MQALTLYELNNLVRGTLELTMDEVYWLRAELSEARVASNGHCYVEFVQKDASDRNLVARARGIIWSNVYLLLAPYFERETGQHLAAGMKVQVAVRVGFHELYGYSLEVTDIDPTYTLGDLVRRRREILQQLDDEGVLTLNRELVLPRLVQRIAVVSSDTAAGYGDFCHQLASSPYRFDVKLFPAIMQGERVEASVIAALDRIAAEREEWDVVAILRGGGAVSDLTGFDTYLLAANCAQFPLPILTGIGHERDETVIDAVAHTRLKTPTAVADFLVERMEREENLLVEMARRVPRAALGRLEAEQHRLVRAALRIPAAARLCMGDRKARLEHDGQLLRQSVVRYAERCDRHLADLADLLRNRTKVRMERERLRIDMADRQVRMASPERFFKLGFSVTLKDGKAVTDVTRLKKGDRLTTILASGEIESVLTNVKRDHGKEN